MSDRIPDFSKDTDYLFLICSNMFCFKYLGNAACQNSPASSASSTTYSHFWVSLHSERIEDVASRSLAMPNRETAWCWAAVLHCSTGRVAGTPEIAESRAREKSPQWPTTASRLASQMDEVWGDLSSPRLCFVYLYIYIYNL